MPCPGSRFRDHLGAAQLHLKTQIWLLHSISLSQLFSVIEIEVPAGSLDISVMYSGLPIYSESRDLCDMAKCPIEKGDFSIAYDQYLPPIVPPVMLVDGQ